MSSPSRQWLILVLLILVIGLVHIGFQRDGHGWGDDFAEYVMHARNLATGQPYGEIDYLYNPHYPQLGPPSYPPGCAVVLAPVYWLMGMNLAAFKLEMVFCFLVFLVAVYGCFQQDLGPTKAATLVLLLGLNHFFLKATNEIASDLPFVALLYLALFLIQKADATPPNTRGRFLTFALVGAVAYLAFGTRTLGALVIPALLAQEVMTTRRISRPVLLATLVFAGLAFLQSLFLHSDRHYLDQLNIGPMVVVHNAIDYSIRLAAFWHSGYLQAPSLVLFGLATLLAVLGYVECLRRRITAWEIFSVLYLAAVLLWPSYQGERLLYPILPLYLFYMLRGLEHRWIAGRKGLYHAVVATLVVGVGLTYAARLAHLDWGPMPEGPEKRESVDLFDYLRSTTSDQDVFVFIKPRALALFTNRKASVYHCPDKDEALWDYFHTIGATRLVVVENDEAFKDEEEPERLAFLRAFVQRNRKRLEPVYANPDFTVYRIEK